MQINKLTISLACACALFTSITSQAVPLTIPHIKYDIKEEKAVPKERAQKGDCVIKGTVEITTKLRVEVYECWKSGSYEIALQKTKALPKVYTIDMVTGSLEEKNKKREIPFYREVKRIKGYSGTCKK